jgi:hypothetical protein
MKKLGSSLLCAALILTCAVAWGDTAHEEGAKVTTLVDAKQHTNVRRAGVLVSRMAMRSGHVHKWLRKARGSTHVKRARCLDRMLSQVHALERLGAIEQQEILAAVTVGHATMADARLMRLGVFETRSKILLSEANVCGKARSRRQRMRTSYRVTLHKPKLPPKRRLRQRRRDASVLPGR